jgi:hypothetical protein
MKLRFFILLMLLSISAFGQTQQWNRFVTTPDGQPVNGNTVTNLQGSNVVGTIKLTSASITAITNNNITILGALTDNTGNAGGFGQILTSSPGAGGVVWENPSLAFPLPGNVITNFDQHNWTNQSAGGIFANVVTASTFYGTFDGTFNPIGQTFLFTGSTNSYLESEIQNTSNGTNASGDFVVTAGNGNESQGYVDMGINSMNFLGYIGSSNDAYLYAQGIPTNTYGGNLWIGAATTNTVTTIFGSSAQPASSGGQGYGFTNEVIYTPSNANFNVAIKANAGVIGNASTATSATNFNNVSYIYPTNVFANGVGDDTLAVSNTIVLANTGNGLTVIDLLGKSYGIYASLPAIDSMHAQLQNGEIDYYSTNGACLTFPNTNGVSYLTGRDQYEAAHLRIFQKAGIPNTNSIGILLGDSSGQYGVDAQVAFCSITNFWRGIEVASMAQVNIQNNNILNNWSNDVYIANSGPDPDMIRIFQNDMNHAEVGGGSTITNQAFNNINIQCDIGCKDVDIEQNNVGGTKAFLLAFPHNSDVISVNYAYNELELVQNDNVHTNYCPVTVWDGDLTYINGQNGNGSGVASSNFTANVGIYATNGFGLNLQDDFIYQAQPGFKVDVWCASWLNSVYFVNTPCPLTERIHNTWQDVGTPYTFNSGQGSLPIYWSNTNTVMITTTPYGPNNNNVIDIFGGGSGGIQVFNNGNAVSFNTAGSVSFINFNTEAIYDQGADSSLLIAAQYSHVWQLDSLTTSTTDLEGSNNFLYAFAPFTGNIVVTNGSFVGNGSGLTNMATTFFTNAPVLGGIYTNNSGKVQEFTVPVVVTQPAATLGSSEIDAQIHAPGGAFFTVSDLDVAGGITSVLFTNRDTFVINIPQGFGYCITSTVSGTGYTAGIDNSGVRTNTLTLYP